MGHLKLFFQVLSGIVLVPGTLSVLYFNLSLLKGNTFIYYFNYIRIIIAKIFVIYDTVCIILNKIPHWREKARCGNYFVIWGSATIFLTQC